MPETAHLADLFERFPDHVAPLMLYTDGILRGDGELSVAEREMIATYTSGLNACTFCYGSHKIYAALFGFDADLMDAMIADLDRAPVPDKLRPLMAYVRKLNTLPSKLTEQDSQAVFDAGWGEKALVEAVQVNALFNMMNRIIEGTGVNFDYDDDPARHPAVNSTPDKHRHSYAAFAKRFA
ncbi:carboxymuconolactone decarboxylase family protein [Sulfitobacter sp. MF3-043]